ncbi:MAG: hypothetical protein ACFBSD_11235 [Paracoccaceae bacterium]
MDYGSTELVLNMVKAMGIGLAAGWLIWGGGLGRLARLGGGERRDEISRDPVGDLAECRAARAELEAELARTKAELAALRSTARPLAAQPAAEAAIQTETSEPTPPSGLLDAAPSEPDDLKQIRGVGPKMESVLNANGIYLFAQIAQFEAADLVWLNRAIESFPGRVERDDWVGQARLLHEQKHGSPPSGT